MGINHYLSVHSPDIFLMSEQLAGWPLEPDEQGDVHSQKNSIVLSSVSAWPSSDGHVK